MLPRARALILAAIVLVLALIVGRAEAAPRPVTKTDVLAMLIDAEKDATASPFWHFYAETADAIAIVSTMSPLFSGEDGTLRTAALFASLQWFESNGNVAAEGDCKKRDTKNQCLRNASGENIGDPQSFGLYQIGRSNFRELGVTREDMTTSALAQTMAAHHMIRVSFGVCRGRAEDDLLGQYASGGSTCGGIRESGHRMRKAKWLFDRAKAREKEATAAR